MRRAPRALFRAYAGEIRLGALEEKVGAVLKRKLV
jgi:hypothetical protein